VEKDRNHLLPHDNYKIIVGQVMAVAQSCLSELVRTHNHRQSMINSALVDLFFDLLIHFQVPWQDKRPGYASLAISDGQVLNISPRPIALGDIPQ
jgi:hypothetical protein